MIQSPEQRLASYRDVLRTFQPEKAPALMASAVSTLRALAAPVQNLYIVDQRVQAQVAQAEASGSPADSAQAKTLTSAHELAKFVAGTPEERASNRVLNSLDRVNAIKFFGPVRNESMEFKQEAAQQVAAEAASLAPVRPEVLAGKIRTQQMLLRELDAKIKAEQSAARRAQLQAVRQEKLKEAAALVTAAKVKELNDARRFTPFDITKVQAADARRRVQIILSRLREIDAEIRKVSLRMKTLKPGLMRTMLFNQQAKLTAERKGLHQRLRLLRTGRDKIAIRRVVTQTPRVPVRLVPGVIFTPAPDMVRVIVRYLAQRIPRRMGESRRQFLLRLRMYVMRALARYAANSAAEPNPAAAAEAAAVATVTDDTPAIESEVDAGGVAEDTAAEAMAEVVEEYIPELEQAAADLAPETVEHSEPEEFVAPADAAVVAAPPSAEFVDSAPEEVVEQVLPEVMDQELEQAFETLDIPSAPSLAEVAIATQEDTRPWYTNPVVLGGAALAALLILRR